MSTLKTEYVNGRNRDRAVIHTDNDGNSLRVKIYVDGVHLLGGAAITVAEIRALADAVENAENHVG